MFYQVKQIASGKADLMLFPGMRVEALSCRNICSSFRTSWRVGSAELIGVCVWSGNALLGGPTSGAGPALTCRGLAWRASVDARLSVAPAFELKLLQPVELQLLGSSLRAAPVQSSLPLLLTDRVKPLLGPLPGGQRCVQVS